MYLTNFLLIKEIDENNTLLINTLSGAIDLIGKKEKKLLSCLLKRNEKISLEKSLETKLRERDYLFNTKEEEAVVFNQLTRLLSERSISLPEFYLCYTYDCNLKCNYCNEKHLNDQVKKIKTMRSNQLEAVLNIILTIKEASRSEEKGTMVLFGGEPLLPINRDSVIRTLNFAKKEKFLVRIISNGTLIKSFREVLSNYQDIIETVAISLDGTRDIHDQRRAFPSGGGSFDQILEGINILLSEGLKVEVRPIVDRENIGFLPDLADFIINQGWTRYENFSAKIAKTMFPFKLTKLDYPFEISNFEFIKQLNILNKKYSAMSVYGSSWLGDFQPFVYLRKFLDDQELITPRLSGCKAVAPGMYIFGPDNLIYPCLELIGIPQYATGRFYPRFEEFPAREQWRKFKILEWSPKCRRCNIITLCGGGCPLVYLVSGNHERDDQECTEIKKTLDTYIEINKTKFLRKTQKFDY